jgi:hypothetical protein
VNGLMQFGSEGEVKNMDVLIFWIQKEVLVKEAGIFAYRAFQRSSSNKMMVISGSTATD